MAELRTRLYRQAVLPVLRSPSAEEAVRTVRELARAGARLVELTTSTPDWPAALARLRDEPDLVAGVGTITSDRLAREALAAGAAFLVSPFPVPGVAEAATEAGVPFVQGGFTPGELSLARPAGVAKVFPAHLGGPRYLRSLAPVLPGLALVPTGGIGWGEVPEWLAAGALAVGIGSGLDLAPDQLAEAFAAVRRDGEPG